VFGPPLDGFAVANRFCAEPAVKAHKRIVTERRKRRESIFIE
jgi:hypothetical protein